MVLTGERIVLAVAAFGVFMYVQRRQRKMSDRFMQNLQQRRDGRPDDQDMYVNLHEPAEDESAVTEDDKDDESH